MDAAASGARNVVEDDHRACRTKALARTVKSCGPDAPTLVSSFGNFCRRRWQKSPVTEESTKETVKTIARGKPVEPVYLW
jgi:hypothetical protein